VLTLQQARCCKHGCRWTTNLRNGHRFASCDTSLVVSCGVDCGRKRRNVYDKKPQRYTKDNRTAHLTARSDKSVAYVTNNKRLYSTCCTVEDNYWQTRSIARLLCDSRATCTRCRPTHPSAYQIFIPTSISFGDIGVQKLKKSEGCIYPRRQQAEKFIHVAIVCVDASQHTKLQFPSLISFGHIERVSKYKVGAADLPRRP